MNVVWLRHSLYLYLGSHPGEKGNSERVQVAQGVPTGPTSPLPTRHQEWVGSRVWLVPS